MTVKIVVYLLVLIRDTMFKPTTEDKTNHRIVTLTVLISCVVVQRALVGSIHLANENIALKKQLVEQTLVSAPHTNNCVKSRKNA